ncbi:MAG: hypothetical protein RMA76_21820 [Deltaproteobacteria bacterium]|jgi:hypothetical protein
MADVPEKLKRLTVELHPELHRVLMTWLRSNDTVGRVFIEELLITALAQSGDFSKEQVAQFYEYRIGNRR